jgi:sigma-B regulation protein RsbU (phosphoserine phosphatase)
MVRALFNLPRNHLAGTSLRYTPKKRPTIVRPRIGFIATDLVDEYEAELLRGARGAALARDASLWCFVGGELHSQQPGDAQRNRIYDLIGPENVDGLVVIAGAVANKCGLDVLARYCERYAGIPMCTIAGEIAGVPAVEVNNQAGMRDAVAHLIRIHGKKKIAFIRGPLVNVEAEERYRAYAETLSEHGLAVDPRIVAPGDFQIDSGVAAVQLFFEARGLGIGDIDAIVAANDSTALGAIHALQKRKIDVPGQIAVVGFDDIEDARFGSPALTTVRQPLREQGEAAVRTVLARINGNETDGRIVLPTHTVLRRSCGCFSGEVRLAPRTSGAGFISSFEVELVKRREIAQAELAHAAQGSFSAVPGWESQLINSFADQLRTQSDRFTKAFRGMLDTLRDSGANLAAVHDVITVLRLQMLSCLEQDWTLRSRAEDMFQDVRLTTSETMERAQAQRRATAERTAAVLGLLGRRLASVRSIQALEEAIDERLSDLSVTACFVSLFDDGWGPEGTARTVIAYDAAAKGLADDDQSFSNRLLASRQWIRADMIRAFVVQAIHNEGQNLGILVVSFGDTPCHVYGMLGEMIGASFASVRRKTEKPPAPGAAP